MAKAKLREGLRTLRSLVSGDEDLTGEPQALLHRVMGRLVERLYFADFRVAERALLIGDRDVVQLLAVRPGREALPGLACVTRAGAPSEILGEVSDTAGRLPRGLWALLTFAAQIDAASLLPPDELLRPLYLILTSGPPWVAGHNVLETFEGAQLKPEWTLVSAPTGCAIAVEQPGMLRLRLRPGEETSKRLRTRLAATQASQITIQPGLDPMGLATVALIERLLEQKEERPLSVHNLKLATDDEGERSLEAVLSWKGGDLELPGRTEDVPDGTPIGPDLSPWLDLLVRVVKRLMREGVDLQLTEMSPTPKGLTAVIEVRYDAPGDTAAVTAGLKRTFEEEGGGQGAARVEVLGAIPPLAHREGLRLHEVLTEAGASVSSAKVHAAEAGILAQSEAELLLFGPGKQGAGRSVELCDADVDLYVARFKHAIRRLLIGAEEPGPEA
jgi:hypothetical protein